MDANIDPRLSREVLRLRLKAARAGIPLQARRDAQARIAARLDALLAGIADAEGASPVAAYWPIQGEPDLRDWMAARAGRGIALPVACERGAALEFARWRPGDALERDDAGVPAPVGGDPVLPGRILVPALGFNRRCFRLGYGAGYYDRTLAALGGGANAIGVAFECAYAPEFIEEIQDVRLSCIVTEERVLVPHPG